MFFLQCRENKNFPKVTDSKIAPERTNKRTKKKMNGNGFFLVTIGTCPLWDKPKRNKKIVMVHECSYLTNVTTLNTELRNRLETIVALDAHTKLFLVDQFLLTEKTTLVDSDETSNYETTITNDEHHVYKQTYAINLTHITNAMRLCSVPTFDMQTKRFCDYLRDTCRASIVLVVYMTDNEMTTLARILHRHMIDLNEVPVTANSIDTNKEEPIYDVPTSTRTIDKTDDSESLVTDVTENDEIRSSESFVRSDVKRNNAETEKKIERSKHLVVARPATTKTTFPNAANR